MRKSDGYACPPALGQFAVLLILYFPLFRNVVGSASAAQMLLNAVVAPLCVLLLLVIIPRSRALVMPRSSLALLLVAWVVAVLSMHYEASLGRTASDVGRLVLASFFLAVGYQLASSGRIEKDWVNRQLLLYGVLGVLFSSLVLVSWAWPVVDLYKGRLSDDPLPFHFLRASGFSGFPTDFGCLLVLILLLLRAQWQRGEIGLATSLIVGAVLSAGIVASAARGAFVQLAGLAAILGVSWVARRYSTVTWLSRRFSRQTVLVLFLCVAGGGVAALAVYKSGGMAVAQQQFQSVRYITEAFAHPDESVLHRFMELQLARDVIAADQPVPRGAERENLFGLQVLEGFWTHYAIRYGPLGVLIGLAIAAILVGAVYRVRCCALGEALLLWLISFYLFVAPFSDVMVRSRGIALYFTLIGLVLGWWHLEERKTGPQASVVA